MQLNESSIDTIFYNNQSYCAFRLYKQMAGGEIVETYVFCIAFAVIYCNIAIFMGCLSLIVCVLSGINCDR